MSVSITNEKEVSIDDIVDESKRIWSAVKKYRISIPGDPNKIRELINNEHPEFCMSYAVVVGYMIDGEFSVKALYKYLKYIKINPWTTHEGYLDAQTEYAVLLYKCRNKHYNKVDIDNLRKNTRCILQQEHDKFMKVLECNKQHVEAKEKHLKQECKDHISAHYKNYGEKAINIPIRIKTDLSCDNHVDFKTIDSQLNDKHFGQLTIQQFELDNQLVSL
jgi:hypothetical protein